MFLIAELGSNPSWNWSSLKEYIRQAALSGADAVKIQMFSPDSFPEWERARKAKVEFPRRMFKEFVSIAHENGLQAGASFFDVTEMQEYGRISDFIKLAAREQENEPLIQVAFRARKQVYRSINNVGFSRQIYNNDYMELFTISEYPTLMLKALSVLPNMAKFYGNRRWGWSSHTAGIFDCRIAKKLGASVIEKHFCLGAVNEPERGHSLTPSQFLSLSKKVK